MLKILFLNLYDDILVEKTKNLEKVMDFKTYVGNRNVSDAEMKNQIRWAEKEGMDAIVCEWDVYDSIIQYKPMVSVYPVTFSSFDTCVILYLLKKELERKNLPYRKVILGTRLPINVQTEILEEMYDFDIFIPAWKEDMEQEFFDSWAERGYEVVVCGPQFSQEVKASGMYHFYDEQVFHYVYFQQDIRRTVQKIAEEKQYRHLLEEMKIMINYSFESICILDKEGKIMICNDQAKATFGMHYPGELTGVCFSDLVSAISKEELDEILYTGKNYFSKVVNVNESTGMLNITPIFDKGIDNGAVVHFTTIQQIDKMESQVKIEFYNKGHFAKYHFTDIIGESEMMVKARKLAEKFAKYNSNVLLYGESGCGKELFAQSIHNASLRSARPFVAVNCGALPSNLLESELFGYVEGAFTGALKKGKKGLFEIAHKGTIFLDEISEMDIKSQTRLLRVLEERVVMKIGDDRVIPIDVRVIAASNKNLLKLVKEGTFREDLYYRLNVLFLNVPPLRKRERDVLLIADSFMKQYGKKYNKWIVLNSEAEQEILSYPWEGNVRQLRNFCERLVIVADDKSISADVIREQLDIIDTSFSENDNDLAADLDRNIESMEDAEKRSIINALKKTGGNRTRTAEILGISKTTLWRKLKYYELE